VHRVTKRVLIFALLVTPALLGLAAYWYLPRPEVPRAEALPEGELVMYAFGVIEDGGPKHPASGNVTLYLDNETQQWLLYFQGYQAPPGRDARLFLCQGPDPQTRSEIEACIQLVVPGRGLADVRGDFLVPLPEEVSQPLSYGSVVTWEMRFDHRHAVAPLQHL
jgi:hypothetical protein